MSVFVFALWVNVSALSRRSKSDVICVPFSIFEGYLSHNQADGYLLTQLTLWPLVLGVWFRNTHLSSLRFT